MTNASERMLVAFAAVFTVSNVGRSLGCYLGRLGFRKFFRLTVYALDSMTIDPIECAARKKIHQLRE
jgi:hypothetical protein